MFIFFLRRIWIEGSMGAYEIELIHKTDWTYKLLETGL